MREVEPLRALGALILRDIGCALRTPAFVVVAGLGVALCWLIAQWADGSLLADERLRRFLLASATVVPALMGGGSVVLFLLVEEREHGACPTLFRAGISLGAMVASKVAAALAFTALTVLACLIAIGAPLGCWAPATLAVTATSLPFLLVVTALGVTLRAYAQTGIWSLVLVVLALPSQVAELDRAVAPLAAALPLEAATAVMIWLVTGEAPAEGWPAVEAVFAAWLAAGAALLAAALRRRAREDADEAGE